MDILGADKAAETAAAGLQTVASGVEATAQGITDQAKVAVADVVSVLGGAVDRAAKIVDDRAGDYLAQLTRLNDLLEKIVDRGIVLKLGD